MLYFSKKQKIIWTPFWVIYINIDYMESFLINKCNFFSKFPYVCSFFECLWDSFRAFYIVNEWFLFINEKFDINSSSSLFIIVFTNLLKTFSARLVLFYYLSS